MRKRDIALLAPRASCLVPPFLPALLHNPHACNVFKKPVGIVYPTLIGKIVSKRPVVDNGIRHLNPHDRPCSGRNESPFFSLGRYGGNCRGSIVARCCPNRDAGHTCFSCKVALEHTYLCPWHDDLLKQ